MLNSFLLRRAGRFFPSGGGVGAAAPTSARAWVAWGRGGARAGGRGGAWAAGRGGTAKQSRESAARMVRKEAGGERKLGLRKSNG